MMLWLELLLCLAAIGYAGYSLSRYGDIITEKAGMSASWIGLIFRTHGRAVLGLAGVSLTWVSLGLFMLHALNSWILFEHAH
jgi:hypothetical protein